MKTWHVALLAALAAGLAGLWPFPMVDTGELYIVDTLVISAQEQGLRLETRDTAAQGESLDGALENLERRTPGALFLRQTQRIIFTEGAEGRLSPAALPREIPLGARVYRLTPGEELPDLETLTPVLSARERRDPDGPTLADLENARLGGTPAEPAPLWEESDEAQ